MTHTKRLTIRNVPATLIAGMDLQARLSQVSREKLILLTLQESFASQEHLMRIVERDMIARQLEGK